MTHQVEHHDETKAEQRSFWFIAFPLIVIILVGGYFLTKDQPIERDTQEIYEKQRFRWLGEHGYINQDFTKDTTYEHEKTVHKCPILGTKYKW